MLKRIAVTVAGMALVLLGLVGIALPVLPGVVLIAAGLAILSAEFVWAARALEPLKRLRARATRKSPATPATDEDRP